jgi:hypothetical protein
MNARERALIKQALRALKIARKSDPVTYTTYLMSDCFETEVMRPLEYLAGWANGTDEVQMNADAEKLHEAAGGGKTLQEQSQNIRKILRIGGGILGALAMFAGVKFIHRRLKTKK